jgi:hypothetical protein
MASSTRRLVNAPAYPSFSSANSASSMLRETSVTSTRATSTSSALAGAAISNGTSTKAPIGAKAIRTIAQPS